MNGLFFRYEWKHLLIVNFDFAAKQLGTTAANKRDIPEGIRKFCSEMPYTVEKLFKVKLYSKEYIYFIRNQDKFCQHSLVRKSGTENDNFIN